MAGKVLKENFVSSPPVIASELAEAYGLEVCEITFPTDFAHIAGFIDFSSNSIFVNADDSPTRRNFTIAHELGHYLLKHHEQDGGYTILLRNPDAMEQTHFEQEATNFAANVLVPDVLLQKYLKDHPRITHSELATIFGVPANVIRSQRLFSQ